MLQNDSYLYSKIFDRIISDKPTTFKFVKL